MNMDSKTILIITISILLVFCVIYEYIKEKNKEKRERKQRENQNFFFKEIGDQLVENSLVNKELLRYLKISSQKYAEEITESQVRIVIKAIFNNSHFEVFNYISKIMKENHIKGNEKEITSKIKLFINNRFHKDFLLLKEFKYKEKSIGNCETNEWKEYLIENILNNVLKEKGEKSLSSTLQNAYDSFKYDMLDKTLS